MKSRRDFLKSALITGVGMGLGKDLAAAQASSNIEKMSSTVPGETGLAWRNTIFCESENDQLKTALDRCAKDLGCRIWYNDDTAPDILAVGSFIHIVDRRLLGAETWRYYVNCCDGCYEDIPCILIDDMSKLPLPKTKFVLQLDLAHRDSIDRIIRIIHEMKDRMNKNLPLAFREQRLPSVQKKAILGDVGAGCEAAKARTRSSVAADGTGRGCVKTTCRQTRSGTDDLQPDHHRKRCERYGNRRSETAILEADPR